MNKKQKRKLAVLAVGIAAVLLIVLGISLILNCAGKDVRQATSRQQQQSSAVIISEILASNKQAVRDPMGTYSDYVELYNTSSSAVNISGYGLSDSETDAWVIPEGTILQPGEYYVIWCAGQETGLKNVANFALSKDDVLRFIDGGGVPITTISLADTYSGLA